MAGFRAAGGDWSDGARTRVWARRSVCTTSTGAMAAAAPPAATHARRPVFFFVVDDAFTAHTRQCAPGSVVS